MSNFPPGYVSFPDAIDTTTASESSDSIDPKENTGRWTEEEHQMFIQGLRAHNKQWKLIADMIKTRTVVQIRTHAQKYFQKMTKLKSASGDNLDEASGLDNGLIPLNFDGISCDLKSPRTKAKPTTPRCKPFSPTFGENSECGFYLESSSQDPMDEMELVANCVQKPKRSTSISYPTQMLSNLTFNVGTDDESRSPLQSPSRPPTKKSVPKSRKSQLVKVSAPKFPTNKSIKFDEIDENKFNFDTFPEWFDGLAVEGISDSIPFPYTSQPVANANSNYLYNGGHNMSHQQNFNFPYAVPMFVSSDNSHGYSQPYFQGFSNSQQHSSFNPHNEVSSRNTANFSNIPYSENMLSTDHSFEDVIDNLTALYGETVHQVSHCKVEEGNLNDMRNKFSEGDGKGQYPFRPPPFEAKQSPKGSDTTSSECWSSFASSDEETPRNLIQQNYQTVSFEQAENKYQINGRNELNQNVCAALREDQSPTQMSTFLEFPFQIDEVNGNGREVHNGFCSQAPNNSNSNSTSTNACEDNKQAFVPPYCFDSSHANAFDHPFEHNDKQVGCDYYYSSSPQVGTPRLTDSSPTFPEPTGLKVVIKKEALTSKPTHSRKPKTASTGSSTLKLTVPKPISAAESTLKIDFSRISTPPIMIRKRGRPRRSQAPSSMMNQSDAPDVLEHSPSDDGSGCGWDWKNGSLDEEDYDDEDCVQREAGSPRLNEECTSPGVMSTPISNSSGFIGREMSNSGLSSGASTLLYSNKYFDDDSLSKIAHGPQRRVRSNTNLSMYANMTFGEDISYHIGSGNLMNGGSNLMRRARSNTNVAVIANNYSQSSHYNQNASHDFDSHSQYKTNVPSDYPSNSQFSLLPPSVVSSRIPASQSLPNTPRTNCDLQVPVHSVGSVSVEASDSFAVQINPEFSMLDPDFLCGLDDL